MEAATADPFYVAWARACQDRAAAAVGALTPRELEEARVWAHSLAGNDAVEQLAAYCLLSQARHTRWSCDDHTQRDVDYMCMRWQSVGPKDAMQALQKEFQWLQQKDPQTNQERGRGGGAIRWRKI